MRESRPQMGLTWVSSVSSSNDCRNASGGSLKLRCSRRRHASCPGCSWRRRDERSWCRGIGTGRLWFRLHQVHRPRRVRNGGPGLRGLSKFECVQQRKRARRRTLPQAGSPRRPSGQLGCRLAQHGGTQEPRQASRSSSFRAVPPQPQPSPGRELQGCAHQGRVSACAVQRQRWAPHFALFSSDAASVSSPSAQSSSNALQQNGSRASALRKCVTAGSIRLDFRHTTPSRNSPAEPPGTWQPWQLRRGQGHASLQAAAHLIPSNAAPERLLSLGQQPHLDARNREQIAALGCLQPCARH